MCSSKAYTLDDDMCRKNEKEGGSDIFPVSSSKGDSLDDDMFRKNEKETGLISILCVRVRLIHRMMTCVEMMRRRQVRSLSCLFEKG